MKSIQSVQVRLMQGRSSIWRCLCQPWRYHPKESWTTKNGRVPRERQKPNTVPSAGQTNCWNNGSTIQRQAGKHVLAGLGVGRKHIERIMRQIPSVLSSRYTAIHARQQHPLYPHVLQGAFLATAFFGLVVVSSGWDCLQCARLGWASHPCPIPMQQTQTPLTTPHRPNAPMSQNKWPQTLRPFSAITAWKCVVSMNKAMGTQPWH